MLKRLRNFFKTVLIDPVNDRQLELTAQDNVPVDIGNSIGRLDVQNPMPVNIDSVHCSDIDIANSDNGDFSGEICDYFDDLTSVNTNSTSDNPKNITITFERSISFYSIALGCNDPAKNFSNVEIKIYGSANSLLHTIDYSSDNTKRNSQTFPVASEVIFFGGNAIEIKFHTSDAVSLSNVFIRKVLDTNARLQAVSELTDEVENINSFRGALNITDGLVHKLPINRYFQRQTGDSTTPSVAITSGDTDVTFTDTTGFAIGSLVCLSEGDIYEMLPLEIINIVGSVVTFNRPIDNDYTISAALNEIEINMNVDGSTTPVSFKIEPIASDEIWQITKIIISMLDSSPMDDGTFGGLTALTNGTLLRPNNNSAVKTIAIAQKNSDFIADMFNIGYADKAPAGQYGLRGEWQFTEMEAIFEFDEATSDYFEILIQDDLTGLDEFKIKAQGRIFGG